MRIQVNLVGARWSWAILDLGASSWWWWWWWWWWAAMEMYFRGASSSIRGICMYYMCIGNESSGPHPGDTYRIDGAGAKEIR
ncbi:hypothetical protein BZA05DRAFT_48271 [Tricharina praecox]|uniref:uncharacterized protein n=1 Tax=Tricharina praecox TaxID=43433 RepID=UPI00221E8812|nr:uncharacterized protein BZA05DRAFT_48271 [Tricharina praecox]KAI5851960.1 hypothetical protein BZA05DRAFT_48271 [Tricharina praecox]